LKISKILRWLKYIVLVILTLLLGPVYMATVGSDEAAAGQSWRTANRSSTGMAPIAAETPEAVIQIYAARTYSWRGHLAVHTWVSTKAVNAERYEVHEVIGWRVRRGQSAVSSGPNLPDRYWYGNQPDLLVDIRGAAAQTLLPRVLAAVHDYPYADTYTTWPGPNSNTFTAFVGREVPELGLQMPVTAIGKDYLPDGALFAATPSGTGYQLSVLGTLGLMLSMEEGLELNLLGLAIGVDFNEPALKLPGIGRIGMEKKAGHF
jgi:hypothetical protein